MLYPDFKDFAANIPSDGRLVGIDWGARRIGVAISDDRREFVFPREIVDSRRAPADSLVEELVKSEKIAGIVIGLPRYADGTDSATTRAAREFAEKISASVRVPVGFVDENLTSVEAEERQAATGKRQTTNDSIAAAIILENAIAMIKRLT
ncbi:MAG: Holliday junction resolvase RuvX [Alphaproteobacteria bacterium]|nr:Holliday junction resolvase RuvX [Alphaproteobacteria bacterium]